MRPGGFQLLRIGGIDVTIDYSWFVIFFLVLYTMAESYFPRVHSDYSTGQYWIMGSVAALLLFVSILLHELAHSFVALRQGIRVEGIRLFIFGGLAEVATDAPNGRQEFLISLAGPATSMGLGAFFLAVHFIAGGVAAAAAGIAWWLGWANILLALLNLIPGFPLDGGRILRAFLWDHWDDMARATRVVSRIGNAFALFLIILGILQFLLTRSLLSGLWLVFIGMFMKQSAVGSYQSLMLKRALEGVEVRQIMSAEVVKVDWLTPLDRLIQDYIYRRQVTRFPVFNREEFVGMVSLGEVKKVSRALWGFKQVRDVMIPVDEVPCLGPTDPAGEALSRMAAAEDGCMPVVEDGVLLGIVTRRDILNLFKIKSDLGAA
ncbi:MAG: site-2 protease family protein [Acidobacteriota bacterium]|jgi:Zn-dependent protease/CBS domain-containing protein|nr:site-2 protease family protein [Acidobacteriota bacterium]